MRCHNLFQGACHSICGKLTQCFLRWTVLKWRVKHNDQRLELQKNPCNLQAQIEFFFLSKTLVPNQSRCIWHALDTKIVVACSFLHPESAYITLSSETSFHFYNKGPMRQNGVQVSLTCLQVPWHSTECNATDGMASLSIACKNRK